MLMQHPITLEENKVMPIPHTIEICTCYLLLLHKKNRSFLQERCSVSNPNMDWDSWEYIHQTVSRVRIILSNFMKCYS